MTRVRLDRLFDCTEQRSALVAESSNGTLRHIDDVPSGLVSDCNYPGCEQRMVAKIRSCPSPSFGVALRLRRQHKHVGGRDGIVAATSPENLPGKRHSLRTFLQRSKGK